MKFIQTIEYYKLAHWGLVIPLTSKTTKEDNNTQYCFCVDRKHSIYNYRTKSSIKYIGEK
jgi:hypothetical protein